MVTKFLRVAAISLALLSPAVFAAEEVPDDIDALLREAAADDAKNAAAAAAPEASKGAPAAAAERKTGGLRGFAQFELARAHQQPDHWSKMLTRVELVTDGRTGTGLKWKMSARIDYDAVFGATNYYPREVRRDQDFNISLRENYIDASLGDWDVRLGRQHVVWGEMVGLFFADVVSARDMREFILPEFNILRIPQWAARAEYFKGDFKGELLWIPVATYDETGKPGGDFFPAQAEFPGLGVRYLNEVTPARRWSNGNYGVRGTVLANGWDLSAFFYRSMDASPTFYRSITPTEVIYEARHDRITQIGGTLAKDFGNMVLKSEVVGTKGRKQAVLRAAEPTGVVAQNTFDWVVSLDVPLPADARLNLQAFQSIITNRDPDVIPKKYESGYSVMLTGKVAPQVEAEVLWVASLDRNDWMLRPKVNWSVDRNWRVVLGADAFYGPPTGLFGRFANRDRMYSEIKYSF